MIRRGALVLLAALSLVVSGLAQEAKGPGEWNESDLNPAQQRTFQGLPEAEQKKLLDCPLLLAQGKLESMGLDSWKNAEIPQDLPSELRKIYNDLTDEEKDRYRAMAPEEAIRLLTKAQAEDSGDAALGFLSIELDEPEVLGSGRRQRIVVTGRTTGIPDRHKVKVQVELRYPYQTSPDVLDGQAYIRDNKFKVQLSAGAKEFFPGKYYVVARARFDRSNFSQNYVREYIYQDGRTIPVYIFLGASRILYVGINTLDYPNPDDDPAALRAELEEKLWYYSMLTDEPFVDAPGLEQEAMAARDVLVMEGVEPALKLRARMEETFNEQEVAFNADALRSFLDSEFYPRIETALNALRKHEDRWVALRFTQYPLRLAGRTGVFPVLREWAAHMARSLYEQNQMEPSQQDRRWNVLQGPDPSYYRETFDLNMELLQSNEEQFQLSPKPLKRIYERWQKKQNQ